MKWQFNTFGIILKIVEALHDIFYSVHYLKTL